MSHIRRCSLATVLAAVLAPSAHAATWTEIPSNTTEDITAVEYQGPDRFWFTTAAGKIYKRVGGVFELKASIPATVFQDIEFQDGGQVGFAVGTNGTVARTQNGGATWVLVSGIVGGRQLGDSCSDPDQGIGDAYSIRFAGNSRVWLAAGGSQLYRTRAGATAANVGSTGTAPVATSGWEWINDNGPSCKIQWGTSDLWPVPGSDSVYFVSDFLGIMYYSSDALASVATQRPARAIDLPYGGVHRLVGDPANTNRQWAVGPGGERGRTTDGWGVRSDWTIRNPTAGDNAPLKGIDYKGGTVLSAGSAGTILGSIDGISFYHEPATGTLLTRDWRSVSLASSADAAVGGTGGKLVVSTDANTVPDVIAPTATISGPATATAGQATTFTAELADNPGGSGVDPASLAWSVVGLSDQSGATAAFTFPSAKTHTVKLTFRDNAGNAGSATTAIAVKSAPAAPAAPPPPPARVAPPARPAARAAVFAGPTTPVTTSDRNASFSLTIPRDCVNPGQRFDVTLRAKRKKRKGNVFVKVTRADFYLGAKRLRIDRSAPFAHRYSVVATQQRGSTITLRARAFIKVRRGRGPKKSLRATVKVCS